VALEGVLELDFPYLHSDLATPTGDGLQREWEPYSSPAVRTPVMTVDIHATIVQPPMDYRWPKPLIRDCRLTPTPGTRCWRCARPHFLAWPEIHCAPRDICTVLCVDFDSVADQYAGQVPMNRHIADLIDPTVTTATRKMNPPEERA
jgi:hypothetical protein